jgi:hypothetical protein
MNGMRMTKILSALGALFSVAAATFLLLAPPGAAPSQASEEVATACRVVESPLDEGYGITRMEKHEVCAPDRR